MDVGWDGCYVFHFSDNIHPIMHYVMHTLIQMVSSMHCSVHYPCQKKFAFVVHYNLLYHVNRDVQFITENSLCK